MALYPLSSSSSVLELTEGQELAGEGVELGLYPVQGEALFVGRVQRHYNIVHPPLNQTAVCVHVCLCAYNIESGENNRYTLFA